jgi:hypothetical protein
MELKNIVTNKNKILHFLCLLLVLERICCLFLYNRQFIDSDQVLYWLSTVEMSQGHFYEPAVYGQAYNSFLESFLAVPLYSMGVQLKYALSIVTHLMALIPLFVLVEIAKKKKNIDAAILMVSYFLLLPAEYMFVTSIPRGFVTGLFSCFVGIWFLEKIPLWKKAVGAGFIGLAMVLNPNAVLLLIPLMFYYWNDFIQSPKLFIYSFIGLIVPFSLYFYIHYFYTQHPDYIIHPSPSSYFNVLHFGDFFSLRTLQSFNNFGPLVHHGGVVVFIFLGISIWKLPTEYRLFKIGVAVLFILIPLLFGFNKIHDGDGSVYFPLSRMFLALPLLLGFVLIHLEIQLSTKSSTLLLSVVLIWFVIKSSAITTRANRSLLEGDDIVDSKKMSFFENKVNDVKQMMDSCHINQLVLGHKNDLLTYGVPAMYGLNYQTLSMHYERRKWHLDKLYIKLPERIIYVSKGRTYLINQYQCQKAVSVGNDSLYVLKDETESEMKFKMLMDSIYSYRK